jgi:positive regulator of sigma E activity
MKPLRYKRSMVTNYRFLQLTLLLILMKSSSIFCWFAISCCSKFSFLLYAFLFSGLFSISLTQLIANQQKIDEATALQEKHGNELPISAAYFIINLSFLLYAFLFSGLFSISLTALFISLLNTSRSAFNSVIYRKFRTTTDCKPTKNR